MKRSASGARVSGKAKSARQLLIEAKERLAKLEEELLVLRYTIPALEQSGRIEELLETVSDSKPAAKEEEPAARLEQRWIYLTPEQAKNVNAGGLKMIRVLESLCHQELLKGEK